VNFEGELKVNDKNDSSEELSKLMSSLLSSDSGSRVVDASTVLEEVIENVPSIIRKNITFKRCSKKKTTSKHTIKKHLM
jgi:hypothetical protein